MSMSSLRVDIQNLIYAMLRQYRRKHVLIRETIQNAIDAGASNVRIGIARNLIEVEDDGSGMDQKAIEDYWNVIAGTSKRAKGGNIGEFGLGRLTMLLVSEKMFMETRNGSESFRVTTERSGKVAIEAGTKSEQGTRVWVEGDFMQYVQDFVTYANVVAKARKENIKVNGTVVSLGRHAPPGDCLLSLNFSNSPITGAIWIPGEASERKRQEKDTIIKLYVNDLFVKDFSTDYYLFGEVNCDALNVVTSRDDVAEDEQYGVFWTNLTDFIEIQFYPRLAKEVDLVNDARVKNDLIKAASKRSNKALIENMMFETISGKKLTGKEVMASERVLVVSEANRSDMEIADKLTNLGQGIGVIAPAGIKKMLNATIGTVERSEASQIVTTLTRGEPATPQEAKRFGEVGKLITELSGMQVEYRKKMAAEAQHIRGRIIINIDSSIFEQARLLIDRKKRDQAAVRMIGTVAHELAHEEVAVHNVEFFQVFERRISRLEDEIMKLLERR
jgi:hypothetical protein